MKLICGILFFLGFPGQSVSAQTADNNDVVSTLQKIVAVQDREIKSLKLILKKSLSSSGAILVGGKEIISDKGLWRGQPADLIGPKGDTGSQGLTGSKGDKGDRGDSANGRAIQLRSCSWTGWVNDWDKNVNYSCPSNKALVGVISTHSNSREDRRHRYRCCSMVVSP